MFDFRFSPRIVLERQSGKRMKKYKPWNTRLASQADVKHNASLSEPGTCQTPNTLLVENVLLKAQSRHLGSNGGERGEEERGKEAGREGGGKRRREGNR